MKTILRNLFLSHWERKAVSAILAVIIWLVINHSLTIPRTLENIAVRIINIPAGLTVDGMQASGVLSKKISLNVSGNKTVLAEITPNDLEVVLDATDKSGSWIPTIQKKSLVSLNPEIDLAKALTRVNPLRLPIHLVRLVTEKIPVIVTHPIGEAPRDYQFLDVWPYHLNLSVSGPENVIKQLKTKGIKLTFNLSNIAKSELDALQSTRQTDEISYAVPDEWKRVYISALSERDIEIDDPQAKALHIDFVRSDLHPLGGTIPVNLFFPPEYSSAINPETYSLMPNGLIQLFHGLPIIRKPLFAKGVSRLFIEVIEDMLELSIILAPKSEKSSLDWSIQFINPKALEDRYVSMLLSDGADDELVELQPKKREEYLRNRFRNYMNRFQLFKGRDAKFDLKIELKGNGVHVEEKL